MWNLGCKNSMDDMLGVSTKLVVIFIWSLRVFTQSSELWAQSLEKLIQSPYDALPTPWRTEMWVQVIAEEGGVGTRSLAHNTLGGRGVCWSFGMGLGRIDKLIHSHGPTHNPHKVVSA
jgi:hypothetical protein